MSRMGRCQQPTDSLSRYLLVSQRPAQLGKVQLRHDPPTYLAGGHHVPVLGVLVHREAEDVICVLQVEALAP